MRSLVWLAIMATVLSACGRNEPSEPPPIREQTHAIPVVLLTTDRPATSVSFTLAAHGPSSPTAVSIVSLPGSAGLTHNGQPVVRGPDGYRCRGISCLGRYDITYELDGMSIRSELNFGVVTEVESGPPDYPSVSLDDLSIEGGAVEIGAAYAGQHSNYWVAIRLPDGLSNPARFVIDAESFDTRVVTEYPPAEITAPFPTTLPMPEHCLEAQCANVMTITRSVPGTASRWVIYDTDPADGEVWVQVVEEYRE